MLSFLIRVVFAAATLGAGVLLLRSHRLMAELETRATAETAGRIVERVEAADNVTRSQSGRAPAFRYAFEFAINGRAHRISSYETTAVHEVGEPVRVRFIPAHLEGRGVDDATWSAYAVEFPPPTLPTLRPVMGWIFVGVGVLFTLSLLASIGTALYFRMEASRCPSQAPPAGHPSSSC